MRELLHCAHSVGTHFRTSSQPSKPPANGAGPRSSQLTTVRARLPGDKAVRADHRTLPREGLLRRWTLRSRSAQGIDGASGRLRLPQNSPVSTANARASCNLFSAYSGGLKEARGEVANKDLSISGRGAPWMGRGSLGFGPKLWRSNCRVSLTYLLATTRKFRLRRRETVTHTRGKPSRTVQRGVAELQWRVGRLQISKFCETPGGGGSDWQCPKRSERCSRSICLAIS